MLTCLTRTGPHAASAKILGLPGTIAWAVDRGGLLSALTIAFGGQVFRSDGHATHAQCGPVWLHQDVLSAVVAALQLRPRWDGLYVQVHQREGGNLLLEHTGAFRAGGFVHAATLLLPTQPLEDALEAGFDAGQHTDARAWTSGPQVTWANPAFPAYSVSVGDVLVVECAAFVVQPCGFRAVG